ncbi:glutaredoxin family protein [Pseudoalteromonas luteoviolacea]|uniref:glutaredoxin family protein n=1 Tax=Pseudoalteromonas luteoviolacea TaxID=43657 RepID=UPI001B37B828|nr:glutaredoxin family protein [Pseudoalteromonas luteoviolacea]MBQ4838677.1 glutaredoxin family protein [Pseudoalteromonas luteoviolacea]
MAKVVLYHTDGCHLCEQAYALAVNVLATNDIHHQDIVEDEKLMTQFQTSIPVIKNIKTGKLLNWPFTQQQIEEFIKEDGFN